VKKPVGERGGEKKKGIGGEGGTPYNKRGFSAGVKDLAGRVGNGADRRGDVFQSNFQGKNPNQKDKPVRGECGNHRNRTAGDLQKKGVIRRAVAKIS